MEQAVHRPGVFNKKNKPHKSGRHRTRGQIEKASNGRLSRGKLSAKRKAELSKAQRRNRMNQLMKNKRSEVLQKKRSRGTASSPPLVVAVVSLHDSVNNKDVLDRFVSLEEDTEVTHTATGIIHINCNNFTRRYSIIPTPRDNMFAVLNACHVADTVLFVLDAARGCDLVGENLISAIGAQGISASLVVAKGLDDIAITKRNSVRKALLNYMTERITCDKLYGFDSPSDVHQLLRIISNQKHNDLPLRHNRPYFLAEELSFADENEDGTATLLACGYLLGQPLSANGLVHLMESGDYQMSKIDVRKDPHVVKSIVRIEAEEESHYATLEESEASLQSTLQLEADSVEMTEHPLNSDETEREGSALRDASDYQSAWILESDGDEGDSDDEADDSSSSIDASAVADDETASMEFFDNGTEVSSNNPRLFSESMTDEPEDEALLREFRAAKQDEMFPDEIDTPMDVPARERFKKYRGLQSFRTSPWNAKENLPDDYGRIYQFRNFNSTQKSVYADCRERSGALPGWYVRIHVKRVPKTHIDLNRPLVIYGLLEHEQRLTVLNIKLHCEQVDEVVQMKSKKPVLFQVGYRRFYASPIYSQHTNGNKHKLERFIHAGSTTVATLFAPVIFGKAKVLVFSADGSSCPRLLASGVVLSVTPDRVVVKRVVLSGHPFRIINKMAVVRYMFFNRGMQMTRWLMAMSVTVEDISWFKPVMLTTKYGRRGYIKEPLGTHGRMKCTFDGKLQSMDTVLMKLYKRVFPKITYTPFTNVGRFRTLAESAEATEMDVAEEMELFK